MNMELPTHTFSFPVSPPGNDVLAYAILRRDAVFKKIPTGQVKYYIDAAVAAGMKAAAHFKGRDILSLCDEYKIQIKHHSNTATYYNLKLRAQFTISGKEKTIELYRKSLEELAACFSGLCGLDPGSCEELVENIHIAHEFFHYWEHSLQQPVNEALPRVTIFRIGKFRHTSTVIQTSEIAAHTFCKEMIGLPFLPNLFDYFQHLDTGAVSEEQLRVHFKTLSSEWEQIKSLTLKG